VMVEKLGLVVGFAVMLLVLMALAVGILAG
jgi:hypothetical protein